MNLNGPANGGGAATSSGILFQQQLGAHFAAQILSGSRLDARLGLGEASLSGCALKRKRPLTIYWWLHLRMVYRHSGETTLSLSDDKKILFIGL
jgi:hypothetical protein